MSKDKQAHGQESIEEWQRSCVAGFMGNKTGKKKEGLWGLFCRILNPTEDFKQRRNTDLCSGNAVLVSLRRIDWKWEKLERNMEVR